MRKRVGLFGGSFDPIHLGHITLAIELFETHKLDEVLFCPAFCSPFKTASPPLASPNHRLTMVRLAVENISKFKVTAIEINRQGPSFMIDTVRALQSDDVQLHLLISEESAAHLDRWKEASQLLQLAPPLIGSRSKSFHSVHNVTKIKVFEISSSEVRERLGLRRYCGHLLLTKVLDYIQAQRLYIAQE